ncbi:hypothetical protein D9V37_06020 [Nocardioides mangrovicus]|uniref:Protein ImuA n=2 Tax=Nocardioides mangrovicus TaxID=2478913 RepID=A0A3L8P6K6_9ACTN|nr:hypothetical protein D9V37_06020 [Nocardioides mangrovicus]
MLRERMRRLGEPTARRELATHPALADVVRLRAGGTYRVDTASLAFLLMAGPSREGAWTALVNTRDTGLEAAAGLGLDLDRTLVVPDAAEHWVEVTAALVEVAALVVLRPPPRVSAHAVSRLAARLRTREAALVVWGEWPRCDAELRLAGSQWLGAGHGEGRLRSRRTQVLVRRGAGPERRRALWLPGDDGEVRPEHEHEPRILTAS